MTVRELIDVLQTFPETVEVAVYDFDSEYSYGGGKPVKSIAIWESPDLENKPVKEVVHIECGDPPA